MMWYHAQGWPGSATAGHHQHRPQGACAATGGIHAPQPTNIMYCSGTVPLAPLAAAARGASAMMATAKDEAPHCTAVRCKGRFVQMIFYMPNARRLCSAAANHPYIQTLQALQASGTLRSTIPAILVH